MMQSNFQFFEFSLRERDKIAKQVLLVFNSFLLVALFITLLVMLSINCYSQPGSTFLGSLLYCLSKQPAIWIIFSVLFNDEVSMT